MVESTTQPGKALVVALAVLRGAIQLIFDLVYYIPSRSRPHPRLTYLQAVSRNAIRATFRAFGDIHARTPLNLKPGRDGARFVAIPVSSKPIYLDDLVHPHVRPAETGGTWYPDAPAKEWKSDEKVVLYLHGGCFVIGEGRASSDGKFAGQLICDGLDTKALFVSYRLSSNPGNHFPAALQDVVTSYQYLLDQGYPASSIIISGDSAGANLCIALLRYIASHEGLLPAPAAAVLWSPWLNIAGSCDPEFITQLPNNGSDCMTPNFIAWGARALTEGVDKENPYITPLGHPFRTQTPIWAQVGGLEMMHDEGLEFIKEMSGIEGNSAEIHIEPFASHDILYMGDLTGYVKEARHVVTIAKKFLADVMER